MALTYKEYTLDKAGATAISAGLQEYLNKHNMEKRNIMRIRLTAEELLLNIMESCGSSIKIYVGIGKQFGRQVFRLRYETPPFDPTTDSKNPWSSDIMASLGLSPSWSYRDNVNTVSLILTDKPKRSTVFYIMVAILCALLLGFIGNYLPDATRQGLNDVLLTPVTDGFLGLMRTFSGLMIVLTICSGILQMGDSVTLGRMGKSILLKFICISFAVSIAATILVMPFLNLSFSEDSGGQLSQLSRISQMLFNILPANIIEPFQTGNALQIIVIAILIGGGLLAIGERGNRIRGLTEEAAVLMQNIISSICSLIPVFVFVMLLRQIWSGNASTMLSVIKILLLAVIAIIILGVSLWIISSIRLKCPPIMLLKKVLPPFLVALTTASGLSALPLGMETCEEKLGVKGSLVSFVYPLGSVLYKPSTAAFFSVLACALAEIYDVGVSLSWLIMAVVTITLLVIALPPVPGACILAFTVLFAALGIPAEALVLATTADIVMDFITTGFNTMLLIFRLACEANSLNRLERETLLRE